MTRSKSARRMQVVYIAGPFTGPTAWDVEQNVRRAEAFALEVARLGAMPLCPHTNTRFFYGQCDEEFWYAGTMELLCRCDAVFMVPGWEHSKGATAERARAVELGISVFHGVHGLSNWLHSGE